MTELREFVKEIIPTTDISLQQILNNLLDGSKDLDLKTHIFKPKQLASLVILSSHLKSIKLLKTSKIIDNFVKKFLRYMVSFKRLSRTEIIKAFSNLKEINDDLSTTKKMTTPL